MIILSTRWPEDKQFQCPTYSNLKIQPADGDGQLSQTKDGNGNVTGLQWTWSCYCGEQHTATITRSELVALNIPPIPGICSPIVAATIEGTVFTSQLPD